ncbi:hypothetical protein HanXRQr2_Chr17g0806671 [Helianthus annuus]|nr:hypothetical protein HanXRQr2_Chr17g0806671 [Helianthus annuus]
MGGSCIQLEIINYELWLAGSNMHNIYMHGMVRIIGRIQTHSTYGFVLLLERWSKRFGPLPRTWSGS